MATISFSTKPQKKYYTYKDDGCIIEISSSKPTTKPSKGGVWYCYFECIPYHRVYDKTTQQYSYYQLYEDKDCTIEVTKSSYNKGETYYYSKGSEHAQNDPYYCANGLYSYAMPNLASELPQVTYNETEGDDSTAVTRYFDTLIVDGDVYKDNKFTAIKFVDVDSTKTTATESSYGERLLEMVNNSVSIDCFTKNVDAIPDYLKSDIESIGYSLTLDYFAVYGTLFLNLLINPIVDTIQTYIDKYADATTYYSNIAFTHSVTTESLAEATILLRGVI